jgi:S1-C subfamily serine protease
MKFGSGFIGAVAGVLVGGAIVGAAVWAFDLGDSAGDNGGSTQPTASGQPASSGQAIGTFNVPTDYAGLYEKVRPSIVEITTGDTGNNAFENTPSGLGSGVVIDGAGNILTNNHVITGFDTVTVTFWDGTVAQASVTGTDPGNDIAIVKANVDDTSVLRPAELGDSSQVKVGELVAAIGNPFGLEGSFTTGVISGLDRTLSSTSTANGRPMRGLLQTDAAVNPGNSGGALISLDGKVIGINTAIATNGANSTFTGVAYAVPINTPKRFLQQLVSGEQIVHPRLGISGQTLTPQEAKSLGVDQGVRIIAVENGGAGDQAGLRGSENSGGDVITAIDGVAMTKFEDLADYIDSKQVGDEVTLTVRRDGKDIELKARLEAWNSSA